MLGSFRKFSGSIYAKILLGIIIIPFVFWGMGSSFSGGNKNVIVEIDKEKYAIQDFAEYIQTTIPPDKKITNNEIEELLSIFIGDILLKKEIESFGIKISDATLSKLIKSQESFKEENKFSRVKYEKFLLKNNIPAYIFEKNLSDQEKRRQLFNLIGRGIAPPKFLITSIYDNINQKRNIEYFNLNTFFDREFKYSDKEIKEFYEKNKQNYKETYKSVNILEVTPEKLTENNSEYDENFFRILDEIDDLIIEGKKFDSIINKYNIEKPKTLKINRSGKDISLNKVNDLSFNLIEKIFSQDENEQTSLIDNDGKYFIIEIIGTEIITRKVDDQNVKKNIIINLKNNKKRELISQILSKINQNSFNKLDFDKLSKDTNSEVKKIKIENINDNKFLDKEIISQIYKTSEKKVILVYDLTFTEVYMVYTNEIENVEIKDDADDYVKYLNLYKVNLTNKILNTYDSYIKKKYEIDINHNALNTVKNYFN